MRPSRTPTSRPAVTGVAITVAASLLLAACGGGGKKEGQDTASSSTTATTRLSAAPDAVRGSVASYDLAVGPQGRFMLGMFNDAKGPIGYGTVGFSFFFLGVEEPNETREPGPTAVGTYVPLAGSPPPPGDASKPVYLSTDQRGVYAADVGFDKAGWWGVTAAVDIDGGAKEVKTAFKVLAKHAVPAVGDAAPATQNLTLNSPGATPESIDSRASASSPVPDADLHQTTVAQAMSEKRPVLLVISTPTYCVSLFCGPITDVVADLAKTYADRARFIHIEVWKDYKGQELNDAAKEWIAGGENINEPWIFLIGADGKISARFDNITNKDGMEVLLKALPKMKS